MIGLEYCTFWFELRKFVVSHIQILLYRLSELWQMDLYTDWHSQETLLKKCLIFMVCFSQSYLLDVSLVVSIWMSSQECWKYCSLNYCHTWLYPVMANLSVLYFIQVKTNVERLQEYLDGPDAFSNMNLSCLCISWHLLISCSLLEQFCLREMAVVKWVSAVCHL